MGTACRLVQSIEHTIEGRVSAEDRMKQRERPVKWLQTAEPVVEGRKRVQ